MPAASYLICRVLGIPIRAHITLLVFLPVIALYVSGQGQIGFFSTVALILGFFASIALHELGHSVVAMRYGCSVRKILLMPIGGVAELSHFPADPGAEIRIALAGPAVSFTLFGALGLVGYALLLIGFSQAAILFGVLSSMNLILVLFNLLPSFPMDGGRVFRAFMTPRMGRVQATRLASKIGQWMAIAFGLYALYPPFNILLIAIAIFVHRAAGAEYRMVRMQEMVRTAQASEPRGGLGSVPPEDILVSPPPYAKSEQGKKSIWSELLGFWGPHR